MCSPLTQQPADSPGSGAEGCGAAQATAAAAQRGLTRLLFVVGGEQWALVARSRLGLLLLWLLAGEGTVGHHRPLLKGRVVYFPRHSAGIYTLRGVLLHEATMTAQATASREPGSPVDRETVEAPKRSCPGPGITKCLSHVHVGAQGQERAGACPQGGCESEEESPAVSPHTWPGACSPLRTAAGVFSQAWGLPSGWQGIGAPPG